MSVMQKVPIHFFSYLISSDGLIWSLYGRHRKPRIAPMLLRGTKRLVRHRKRKSRYLIVTLLSPCGHRRRVAVHRLVAETFIPNPLALPEVDHINHDTQDNRAENLRWVTHKQNCGHRRSRR